MRRRWFSSESVPPADGVPAVDRGAEGDRGATSEAVLLRPPSVDFGAGAVEAHDGFTDASFVAASGALSETEVVAFAGPVGGAVAVINLLFSLTLALAEGRAHDLPLVCEVQESALEVRFGYVAVLADGILAGGGPAPPAASGVAPFPFVDLVLAGAVE